MNRFDKVFGNYGPIYFFFFVIMQIVRSKPTYAISHIHPGWGGGGYSLTWVIRVSAAGQGMIFWPRCPKQQS